MEALGLRKPLIVVTNAALMDDHQQELAQALELQVGLCWWPVSAAGRERAAARCALTVSHGALRSRAVSLTGAPHRHGPHEAALCVGEWRPWCAQAQA
jgi:UDP-N-acetylglucosamine transferase subunit ALG13